MVDLERSYSSGPPRVEFPAMRADVITALGSLSDFAYQRRVWAGGQVHAGEFPDSLNDVVHWLFDDTRVLPDPADSVGSYLLPGDEVERLRILGKSFSDLLEKYDVYDTDSVLADARWPQVCIDAANALSAMIRAGGWGRDAEPT